MEDAANHHYSSYRGLAELRSAFAEWYQARFGVSLDPETEVVPLIGSKEGIGHIHLAYVDPGDEVLIPDPGYPTYQGGTILAGGRPPPTTRCVPRPGSSRTSPRSSGKTSAGCG